MLARVGLSARTEKGTALLVTAGLPVATVTLTEPPISSVDGIVPDSVVSEEVPVAVSAVAPNIIVPFVRPVPVTVSVSCAPPAFAEVGVSEKIRGPVKAKLLSAISQTPRPCVAARSVRDASCRRSDNTATRGRPVPSVLHVQGRGVQTPT